jgi:transposase
MTVYVRLFENQEQEILQAIGKARSMPIQLVQRASIMMRSAEGKSPPQIAGEIGLRVGQVREWIKRFNENGLVGLFDQPRSGRPREYTAKQALQVIEAATTLPAECGAAVNSWSLSHLQRYLEEETKVGRLCRETIRGILHEHGISYQEAQRWQESNDPEFEAKKEVIISCYLNPPPSTGRIIVRARNQSACLMNTHGMAPATCWPR